MNNFLKSWWYFSVIFLITLVGWLNYYAIEKSQIYGFSNFFLFFHLFLVSFLLFSAFVSPSGFQISTTVSINSSSISGVNFLMSFSFLRNIIPIWRQFLTPLVVTKSSFIFSKSSIILHLQELFVQQIHLFLVSNLGKLFTSLISNYSFHNLQVKFRLHHLRILGNHSISHFLFFLYFIQVQLFLKRSFSSHQIVLFVLLLPVL